MLTRLIAAPLLLALALSPAWSADDSALRAEVARALPGHEGIELTDEGDLDGDGRPEFAAVMQVPGDRNEVLVAVFKRDGNGQAHVWTKTKPFQNCQHGTEISISKTSLVLNCFHSGDGTMRNSFQERFKWRAGELRLVGSDSRHESDLQEQEISANLLTGEMRTRTRSPGGKWREELTHSASLKASAVPLSEWSGW